MKEKEFMNLEIGKTFNIGYKKLKVLESIKKENGCIGCFFDKQIFNFGCLGLDMQDKKLLPYCTNYNRIDNKNVIFKEVK